MAGYYGYSMSNNAVSAYEVGEKPLSKWTKKKIIELCKEYTQLDISKLTVSELKEKMLVRSSWHHTSKFYNKTDFYSLDVDYIEKLTQEDINKIINNRVKKETKPPQILEVEKKLKAIEKAKKEAEKEIRKKEKERKEYLQKLFKYQSNYKRLNMFIDRVTPEGLEKLEAFRKKAIEEKRAELKETWTRQNYTRGLESINDDDFIEYYVHDSIKF